MLLVKCISIRESNPKQIQINKSYYIDTTTLHSDLDGEWYGKIYSKKDNDNYYYIGNLSLRHFRN